MREKLIEMVFNAWLDTTTENGCVPTAVQIADHLIANGVIVPPVNVGQTVYTIPRTAIREWTVVGVWVSMNPECSYIHISWKANGHIMGSRQVNFTDIDKVLYLTREEAEAALERIKE